jgi:hypothetical protein
MMGEGNSSARNLSFESFSSQIATQPFEITKKEFKKKY